MSSPFIREIIHDLPFTARRVCRVVRCSIHIRHVPLKGRVRLLLFRQQRSTYRQQLKCKRPRRVMPRHRLVVFLVHARRGFEWHNHTPTPAMSTLNRIRGLRRVSEDLARQFSSTSRSSCSLLHSVPSVDEGVCSSSTTDSVKHPFNHRSSPHVTARLGFSGSFGIDNSSRSLHSSVPARASTSPEET